jgi:hypothetical protein
MRRSCSVTTLVAAANSTCSFTVVSPPHCVRVRSEWVTAECPSPALPYPIACSKCGGGEHYTSDVPSAFAGPLG